MSIYKGDTLIAGGGSVLDTFEYVGTFETNGVASTPIDLDNYDYIVFSNLRSTADGDINLFGGSGLSWTCWTNTASQLSRNYAYMFWSKAYSGLSYITYFSQYNMTRCMHMNADGNVCECTGKPTTIYINTNQGTVANSKLVIFRRAK